MISVVEHIYVTSNIKTGSKYVHISPRPAQRSVAPSSDIRHTLPPLSSLRLQATNSSARPDVSIEQSQGFQTVRCLIGC